eukprot:TRINITY_DN2599_c0_g1_i1.p1 TRINITY_DN2599_c0_g1~~TRINITY_DN2599_c0_g1_i1.p1  ORF type:complete len:100 (+),score=16.41 TRINITY_DN2599_c0_g1_i1:314-613(+)
MDVHDCHILDGVHIVHLGCGANLTQHLVEGSVLVYIHVKLRTSFRQPGDRRLRGAKRHKSNLAAGFREESDLLLQLSDMVASGGSGEIAEKDQVEVRRI